ncbi:MAG: sigma-54-dependent transcriptional regulator [Thermodesulfobacteriota bacterium]
MAAILIADDDVLLCRTLEARLKRMGHRTQAVHTLAEARRLASQTAYDLIFLDVMMPDGNGITILPELRGTPATPEVIIITGQGTPDGAELAIKNGAWGYVEKNNIIKEMVLPLTRALEFRQERRKNQDAASFALKRETIVGASPTMANALDLLGQAAQSDVNVLITGETGTGKELFAKGIHDNSSRSTGPFVTVNCAALPGTLAESLLFGHVKGAFTDAGRDSMGLIRQAHQGTLFLDEIGELPLSLQKTFLRVLQEKRFRPVGGNREMASDFRLVAATNRNLKSMVEEGLFRSDLFFRLRAFVIELPPLRVRCADVEALAHYFLDGLRSHYGRGPKSLAPDFLDAIGQYDWPGNIRELRQALERAFAAAFRQKTIYASQLPEEIRIHLTRKTICQRALPAEQTESMPSDSTAILSPLNMAPGASWHQVREAMEREYFHSLIAHTGGNISQASRIAGLSRTRLYQILEKHALLT